MLRQTAPIPSGSCSARLRRQQRPAEPATELQRDRARRLLRTEIAFIASEDFFRQCDVPAPIDAADSAKTEMPPRADRKLRRDLPAHLVQLCDSDLLNADEERALFRRMNYLKFRANSLRAKLDPEFLEVELLDSAEKAVLESRTLRDRIVRANLRLVVSIVKKFVSLQLPFDDLLSDGTLALMKAVEGFDYNRGFRFSTYAYQAIARGVFRTIAERKRHISRFTNNSDQLAEQQSADATPAVGEQHYDSLRRGVADMLNQLDEREYLIICGRYGLGKQEAVRTFQSLAEELGISKERVRQLEQRAFARLRGVVQTGLRELLAFDDNEE